MNRFLLATLLLVQFPLAAQQVILPYNPDANQDSAIGAPDLLEFLPLFGGYFAPDEVTIEGQTLTEYIVSMEEAAETSYTLDSIANWIAGLSSLYEDLLQAHAALQAEFELLRGILDAQSNGDGTITFTFTDGTSFTTEDLTGPPGADGQDGINGTNGTVTVNGLPLCVDEDNDGICDWADAIPPCGTPKIFDGYTYETLLIGDQCWFAENLRTTVYTNGDVIPAGLTDGEWTSTTSGATAVYGEGSISCDYYSPDIDACDEAQSLAAYGRLYNWYAVDDARGLCPAGWHVPTDGEWTELVDYITSQGFVSTEGMALKSTMGWAGNGNGTDDFGFGALPGGYRYYSSGYFDDAGSLGYWWSSSPNSGDAWHRSLNRYNPEVHRASVYPRFGFSVRCLRDAE